MWTTFTSSTLFSSPHDSHSTPGTSSRLVHRRSHVDVSRCKSITPLTFTDSTRLYKKITGWANAEQVWSPAGGRIQSLLTHVPELCWGDEWMNTTRVPGSYTCNKHTCSMQKKPERWNTDRDRGRWWKKLRLMTRTSIAAESVNTHTFVLLSLWGHFYWNHCSHSSLMQCYS